MNGDNEDKKIDEFAEQWVNLLFAQIRREIKTQKNKNENQKNG